jgi:hypothetical protein
MNLNSAKTTMVITPKVESSLPIQPVIPAAGSAEINLYDPELRSNTAMYQYQAENLAEPADAGDLSYSIIGYVDLCLFKIQLS